jgi:RND family efflux transporter MFP subunit
MITPSQSLTRIAMAACICLGLSLAAPAQQAARASTTSVQQVAVELHEMAPGTLRARNESLVASRLLATVAEVRVTAGDAVAEGEVMFVLENRDLVARRSQTEESLRAAQARLDDARRTLERQRELLREGVTSQAEFDRAETALRSAEAEVQRLNEAMTEAQTNLDWATVRAPLNGRVIDRLVQPGETVAPGTPLARIFDPRSLRLEAETRESLAAQLRPGQEVSVMIDATGQRLTGRVEEIVPLASPGSRTLRVKVAFEQPTDAEKSEAGALLLYPGMFGRMMVPQGTRQALVLPSAAVRTLGQLHYVELADAARTRRFVRLGRTIDAKQVEVLSGLDAGETVLLPTP